jgi:hypothetical protein
MNLSDSQVLLARLYTDAGLRERFFSKANSAEREFGLHGQEAGQLSKLSAAQVNFFADSLIRKRLGEASKLLPLTRKALGTRFDKVFRSYAENHHLDTSRPYQNDAISFSAILPHSARTEFTEIPWAVDLARFEVAHLQAVALGRRCIIRLFRYSIDNLLKTVAEGNQLPLLMRWPTLAIWLRFPWGHQRHFFTLSLWNLPAFAHRLHP